MKKLTLERRIEGEEFWYYVYLNNNCMIATDKLELAYKCYEDIRLGKYHKSEILKECEI